MSITYFEYVFVDLNIQHAMHMRPIILSSEVCPAVQYLKKGSIFEKKLMNVQCVF
jgi:hypothetical protein